MLHVILLLIGNVLVMTALSVITRTLLLWRHNVFILTLMLCAAQLSGIFLHALFIR